MCQGVGHCLEQAFQCQSSLSASGSSASASVLGVFLTPHGAGQFC